MTRDAFIKTLCRVFAEDYSEVYRRGIENGWLEQQDREFRSYLINRRNAARIIHNYLLKEKNIPDLSDISEASELKDLYDCRVCVNHIAQVYLRGIMDSKPLSRDGKYIFFDHERIITSDEAEVYLNKAFQIVSRG